MSRGSPIPTGARLSALRDITLDIASGETPCGKCMGSGCKECEGEGVDLDSLWSIRRAFAAALEVVAGAKKDAIDGLARELRGKEGDERLRHEREAEELRSGIERLIEEKGELVRELVALDADELAVKAVDLRELLDGVDARDSLRFREHGKQAKKSRRKKR